MPERLFSAADGREPAGPQPGGVPPRQPLAHRMRPATLDEVVGQEHLLGEGRLLRRLIETGQLRPLILFGPPGCGKTSLIQVISNTVQRPVISLNAVASGVKELREAIAQAGWQGPTILHVDEVHRFARNQVETVLPAVEDGTVTFIGTTTENPYLSLPPALRSRTTILELKPLTPAAIMVALERALTDPVRGLGQPEAAVPEPLRQQLAEAVGGDLRLALNVLELAVTTAPGSHVTEAWLEECLRRQLQRFSTGDAYDLLSALQKSIRGSDPDAAVYYLARLVSIEFDLPTICRRLVIIAAEDVGNAYPQALPIAHAAAQTALMTGYPEARIPLAQAVTFLAACPKSNAAYKALDRALADIAAGKGLAVPPHLQDAHYKGAAKLGRGQGYVYPHDFPGNWVPQQYLPDDIADHIYYRPTENGQEKAIGEKLERLRRERRRGGK